MIENVEPRRIAMWSGPRNISTAMMRSFENREDTLVSDEPFYAYYLQETGIPHPGAKESMAAQSTDWRDVVSEITAPMPADKSVFYQKQMTHHLLSDIDRGWFDGMSHCFLIRDPAEVIASYLKRRPTVTRDDVGMHQQAEIFDFVAARSDGIPTVLDARDVLLNPERMLRLLCEKLQIPFSERMLHWPPGARESDGVWGKYWYDSVWQSTGFAEYQPKNATLPEAVQPLVLECQSYYERLYELRLGQ